MLTRKQQMRTALNTALAASYADPEKYHEYVLSRGRNRLAEHVAEIAKQRTGSKHLRALDLGAGTGIISSALLRQGFAVTAADADPAMVKTAAKKLPGVTTKQLDFNRLFGFKDNSFDVVTTVWANRYITKGGLTNFLNETYRVLEPGGVFVGPVFSADRLLWKLRAELRQPTSVRALAVRLANTGFIAIEIDDEYKKRNRRLKELPNWVYPVYLIGKKG